MYSQYSLGVILGGGGGGLEDNDSNARRGVVNHGRGGGWQRLFITNIKYLCSKTCDNRGLPQNLLWGQAQKCPPPCRKRDPPPHRKNGPSMRGS